MVGTTELPVPDGFSRLLSGKVLEWRYEDLPAAVIHKAKLCVIDVLGVTAGAASAPGVGQLNKVLDRWESSGSCTGLIGRRRYSAPTAALANGAAAHALDFDDQHDNARVHTGCVLFPALLATAQDVGSVTGKEFLLAYITGAEIHSRLGLACPNSLSKGWHPTAVLGALAAGMACARLLRLDEAGMLNALGLAFHQASGTAQGMYDGALSKRLGAGFAARSAVTAALFAAEGLTGAQRPLEGAAGLFSLFERGQVHPAELIDGLGRNWRVLEYSFKPYPCCRCSHGAIDIGIELHRTGLRPSDVRHVEIKMGKVNWHAVGAPYDLPRTSVVHAQFNASYAFARALLDGKVDLSTFDEREIRNPVAADLAAKINVLPDEAISPNTLAQIGIAVTLNNGRLINRWKETVKGSPEEPLTEDELKDKFDLCLRYGYGPGAELSDLFKAILSLEHVENVADVIVGRFPAAQEG